MLDIGHRKCLCTCYLHYTPIGHGPQDAPIYATVMVSQIGNAGTAIKSDDTGKKDTVAVPELQRIQELHRVILAGVDVFAQVRFPN